MYEDACGGKSSTGITLDSTTYITVSNLSLDGQCKTELTEITFSVDSAPAGTVTLNLQGPESESVLSLTCTTTDDLAASCPISLSTKGTYTVQSIESDDTAETFVLPTDINPLIYEPATNSLAAEGQTNAQTIDASQSKTTFTVVLDGEDKAAPIIYLNNDESKVVQCTRAEASLICTPTTENIPDSTSSENYEVYYKTACSAGAKSTIVVTKVGTDTPPVETSIKVTKVSLSSNSESTCTTVAGT